VQVAAEAVGDGGVDTADDRPGRSWMSTTMSGDDLGASGDTVEFGCA
jgi:hypothetical protein